MTSNPNRYLPHRRQRPMTDNEFSYQPLEHIQAPTPDLKAPLAVLILGLGIGLGYLSFGNLFISASHQSSPQPQVAGLQSSLEEEVESESEETVVCWNQVLVEDGSNMNFVWQDACRGLPPDPMRECAPNQPRLTQAERLAYLQWYQNDAKLSPECQALSGEVPAGL